MNAGRLRLSVAVLISIAVHGAIASFGDFTARGVAAASGAIPVAVTIVSMAETEIQQAVAAEVLSVPEQKPSLQELKPDVTEQTKTDLSVPATTIPVQQQPTESSNLDSSSDNSREANSSEPVETPPSTMSKPDQSQPDAALVSTSANRLTSTSVTSDSNYAAQAAASQMSAMPEIPDVTAMPLYYLIPKPPYPSRSRDLGEEGLVIVAVLVSKDGSVLEAYVSDSSGFPLLDGSALATVKEQWRFKPGMRGGNAVSSWVRVPIKFNITGS